MLLLFAFWLLCDFFLLSVWQKTAQPLRSSFLLQGAIDRLFLSTTWEMYPLRFQVQISRIQRQKNSQVHVFLIWWLVKNYLQVNKSNIQLFLVLCWYLETGQEIHQLKKIQWNNHKGKSKYLFIYLFIILFIYLFIYLFIIYYSF